MARDAEAKAQDAAPAGENAEQGREEKPKEEDNGKCTYGEASGKWFFTFHHWYLGNFIQVRVVEYMGVQEWWATTLGTAQ